MFRRNAKHELLSANLFWCLLECAVLCNVIIIKCDVILSQMNKGITAHINKEGDVYTPIKKTKKYNYVHTNIITNKNQEKI